MKRAYSVCSVTDLEQGKAEVVLDDRVGRLEERRFPQWTNSISRPRFLKKPSGPAEQRRDLPRMGRGCGHGANLSLRPRLRSKPPAEFSRDHEPAPMTVSWREPTCMRYIG